MQKSDMFIYGFEEDYKVIEEKNEPQKPALAFKSLASIIYIVVGVLAIPYWLFIFIMAHDAPERNSLQTEVEIFSVVFIFLYSWGLSKLLGKQPERKGGAE